jgi:hypothetical protein
VTAPTGAISTGTIVLAPVCDPNGTPVYHHYAVVLNPKIEILAGSDLRVAVCSTNMYPLRSGWFPLPTKPGGHAMTGLTEACVVKATWIQIVPQASVIAIRGRCPARIFKQVQNWLVEKERHMGGGV